MSKNWTLYSALICALALYWMNNQALEFNYYWLYWWYDVIMHFFAGFIGGLATYWVLFGSGFAHRWVPSKAKQLATVFLCVMVVGFLWEGLELVYGLTNSHEGYPVDPLFDLVLDGGGALIAAYLGFKQNNG
jgi:hypothetical protein